MICNQCNVKMETEGSPLYPSCSECHSCFCSLECFEEHDSWCSKKAEEQKNKIHLFRCCDCDVLKEENGQQPVFVPCEPPLEAKGVCSLCAKNYSIPEGM